MGHCSNDEEFRLIMQAKKKPEPGSGKSRETREIKIKGVLQLSQEANSITINTKNKQPLTR
jgi:hypothetical protein